MELAAGIALSVAAGIVVLDISEVHVENVGKYLTIEVPSELRPASVVTNALACSNGYSACISVYPDGRVYVRSYGGVLAAAWGQVSWVPALSLNNQ